MSSHKSGAAIGSFKISWFQIKRPVELQPGVAGFHCILEKERRRMGLDRNPIEQIRGRLDNIRLTRIPRDIETELSDGVCLQS